MKDANCICMQHNKSNAEICMLVAFIKICKLPLDCKSRDYVVMNKTELAVHVFFPNNLKLLA